MGAILGVLIIAEIIDELLPGFEGTIGEFGDFDCEADCNALHDALHGSIRGGLKQKNSSGRVRGVPGGGR